MTVWSYRVAQYAGNVLRDIPAMRRYSNDAPHIQTNGINYDLK
jgi:hypothetical protein